MQKKHLSEHLHDSRLIIRLIDEAFKITINIAKEEDLVKIHHVSLKGIKFKVITSMNKLTNEQQL